METDVILILFCTLLCGISLFRAGFRAMESPTPMPYYTTGPIRANEITDIKAFNKANGSMWMVLGALCVLIGILAVLKFYIPALLTIFIMLAIVMPVMKRVIYPRILKKYKA